MSSASPNNASQSMPGGNKTPLTRERPQAAGVTPVAARWATLSDSLGVILLDISLLNNAIGSSAEATLQPLGLEQIHAMLGRALEAQEAGTRATPAPDTPMPSPTRSPLTRRQQDILREAARGNSNAEIAQTLHISVDTVKTHVRQILMRLDARNRTELAAIYQRTVCSEGLWH